MKITEQTTLGELQAYLSKHELDMRTGEHPQGFAVVSLTSRRTNKRILGGGGSLWEALASATRLMGLNDSEGPPSNPATPTGERP